MPTLEAENLTAQPLSAEAPSAEEVAALTADAPADDPRAFVPTDAGGVDWVLRKVSAARAEAKLIRENMEKMARACERQAEALEWKYGPALQTWLRAETEGGKRKSKTLPHGVLGYRTKPAGVNITDATAAGQWAREFCPDALVTSMDRKALGAALLETGEVVDFAAFTPAEEVFFIR